MGANLYVGNVSYDTVEASLREVFAEVGTVVSCSLVIDKATGRSRGFAFVEMSTPDEANKAIQLLNGRELDGRPLVINEARPRDDRPRREWR
ncbi:MAG: RNA-binding protein [Lentisphaerae bacterium]|nr:RNA-binding protein [Lentisphaerota bacterium]